VSKELLNACLMLLICFILISLITIVNSKLASWGLFLYLPGMFFLSTSIFFNSSKAFIICLITGLFMDVILITPFGYHGIVLPTLQILSKEWLKYNGNNNAFRYVCFQLISNILLTFILFLIFKFQKFQIIEWTFSRFSSDLILSTIVFIPLCFWFQDLVTRLFKIKEERNSIIE
jgi:cell shape-determining protein MreD